MMRPSAVGPNTHVFLHSFSASALQALAASQRPNNTHRQQQVRQQQPEWPQGMVNNCLFSMRVGRSQAAAVPLHGSCVQAKQQGGSCTINYCNRSGLPQIARAAAI
jgi:hypothetical protein